MFLQLYCNITYLGASYKPLCPPEPVTLHGLSFRLLLLNHNIICFERSPLHFYKVPYFKVRIPRSSSIAISSYILTIYAHQRPPYHLHHLPLSDFPFNSNYLTCCLSQLIFIGRVNFRRLYRAFNTKCFTSFNANRRSQRKPFRTLLLHLTYRVVSYNCFTEKTTTTILVLHLITCSFLR